MGQYMASFQGLARYVNRQHATIYTTLDACSLGLILQTQHRAHTSCTCYRRPTSYILSRAVC